MSAPPSMGTGPWPVCCGRPMWFGPRGYACECSAGQLLFDEAARVVQLPDPVELPGGQFILFDPTQARAA